ncbi:cytochrome c oxidase subunit 4 [Falsarthrobacter nasiphocae]|uniref:Cytochrome c oxidase polypeptide 4 n=1 Tax=Falsarthrobacter nasiphocae TaxID=189863 RepID=A0AAE3YF62_9MICC|nr:cytochrome c oxidase subunit 4 [Falsarthrobacter nasiphocae]MDR6891087.1 fatty acid desaturase [Falsarthrobacter nasiphocae]
MKIESNIFLFLVPFFLVVGVVYGFMTEWTEWVGMLAIPVTGLMALMIGFYLSSNARRLDGLRPEDRLDAEIHEGSGEQGLFSPWSWWPLVLALGAAGAFLGLAMGWWVFFIAAGIGVVGVIGWVYEYSRGDHAH